ncbi:methanol dehydrogenase, partial [Pseudomonas syringae pv. actinidiae]|nr:methanol dehydrogenase [Pseudomonas syringae pv. actinidiae]
MKSVSRLMLYMVMLLGGVFRADAQEPALVFPPMTGSVVDAAQML